MIRLLASLGAVLLLFHAADAVDWLSGATQAITAGLLGLLGIDLVVAPGEMRLGRLIIPWTRDCAGINILALMWAITLWGNRAEAFTRPWALRLALALPASLLANTARVLTLIGYRWLAYPHVESPQLHYFIGFAWLLPFLCLLIPRRGKPIGWFLAESMHLAVTLSLAAPLVASPGGSLVIACVLLCLAHDGFLPPGRARSPWPWGWAAGGLAILVFGLESLWLPWVLACPAHAGWRAGIGRWPWWLLPATLPVIVLQPWALMLFWPLVLATGWVLFRPATSDRPDPVASPEPAWAGGPRWIPAALLCLLFTPFATSMIPASSIIRFRPPPGALARPIGMNGYEVRVLGQSPDVNLTWYGPQGTGRHHTLPVCMRFRGIHLRGVPSSPGVLTDGRHWLGEFFLLPGKPPMDYRAYIRHTFRPFARPGSHVIVSAPMESMAASSFAQTVDNLAIHLQPGNPR